MIKLEEFKEDKTDNSAFNGALHTLDRINELIQHISIYTVNDHFYGLKQNLRELLIEGQGFLSKTEYQKAWKDWLKIDSKTLKYDSLGNIIFDDELPNMLYKFSGWLRYKLHKHKVTMAGKKDIEDGLSNIYNKFKLPK